MWADRLIEDTGRVIWALWVGASSGRNNDDLIMCVNACVYCSNQKKPTHDLSPFTPWQNRRIPVALFVMVTEKIIKKPKAQVDKEYAG